ncbi:ABC transporter substrate-binding protein [Lacrimispora sphenoides]|uniref:Arabinosaccharide transport system substrate-binding protein n=1 Tax=Lacrimispora sphenoides JCM 1415 TaxID=1297793 RepID=A0ABY1CBM9_9FIRM|nr:ABC transporter substrate-binding protein [Lacrimispora sphenoides]SET89099.1 arabinosaccharide transport system substrate-binding protein [[Clostridium] sphenoides JCM 1415]SUY52102.1 putative arabinose-binding protein AraN [Lacrimispora sphenoides]
MKKRVLAGLLCVAMAASMITGCNSAKGVSGETTKGVSSAGKKEMEVGGNDVTTLNVWTFIELHQNFYVAMAEKWNEAHPDKKVKLVLSNMPYDDMHNKLSLALESGEGAPDIVDIELGKFPAFMTGKIGLMELNDAIEPYRKNIVKSRLDIYTKDGKEYGFPTHVGTTVAFYNEKLLSDAGINYEDIKTWDQFKEAGVKYYETTGKYFACVETSAQWMVNLMLAQKGGDYVDENGKLNLASKEMAEVLEYIKGLQETGAFATIPGGQPDNEEAYPFYNSGDYAVQIMPFWQTSRYVNYMKDLKKQVAIATVPVWNESDKEVATIGGGGTGTAIVKSGKHAQLAAEVMAYIKLSEEANKEVWNVLGFDPVNTAVWSDTSLTQNPDNQFVQYFTNYPFDILLKTKDSIGALRAYTDEKYPSINNEFCNVTLNSIFEDGVDVTEALQSSQETLNNEFKE